MSRTISVVVAMVVVCGMFAVLAAEPDSPTPTQATGIVYHDVNGNQQFDAGDRPLPGVRVSNGDQIVATDGRGRYELPVDDDTIVFVIKPRGWTTPLSEDNLPQFFYIHKPAGSPPSKYPGVAPTGPLPESVDFPLTPQNEPQEFQAILFGDTQPRNQQEVDWIAHDVVEDLMGTDASFGVTLGDIVFDDLNVMQPLKQDHRAARHSVVQRRRQPRHQLRRRDPPLRQRNLRANLRAVLLLIRLRTRYTSWCWTTSSGRSTRTPAKGATPAGIGEQQLEFIKTDLAQIPEDQLVVLLMHIPLRDVGDRQDLYRLIEQRPFCMSISAHHHVHEHVWITHEDGWRGPQPHHHIINVTVCGSWWGGAPDERGIPHTIMADGAPNGYSIMSFDGTDYALDFYAAGRSPDYQMEIDAPELVKQSEAEAAAVFVNVFNGSEKTTVEMRIGDGEWTAMDRTIAIDPKYQRVFDHEAALLELEEKWRKLPKPKESTHLWRHALPADLPSGTHRIEIRATDENGRVHEDQRIIRIAPADGE